MGSQTPCVGIWAVEPYGLPYCRTVPVLYCTVLYCTRTVLRPHPDRLLPVGWLLLLPAAGCRLLLLLLLLPAGSGGGSTARYQRPEAYCGLLSSGCGHKVSWEIPGVAYSPVYFRLKGRYHLNLSLGSTELS